MIVLLVCFLLLQASGQEIPWYEYRSLGVFSMPKPAFTFVNEFRGQPSLMITSFGTTFGSVSIVPSVADHLSGWDTTVPDVMVDDIIWPNEVEAVPEAVFGEKDLFLVCGGFLAVPRSNTGQVTLLDGRADNVTAYQLSTDEEGFFYHSAHWLDVDADGDLDIITAKVDFPTVGTPQGRLLWLENPGDFTTGPWTESFLHDGPDVFFRLSDLDGDGILEIVATQFFSEKLALLWNDVGNYADAGSWHSRVIDDTIGAAFDVVVVDLNRDGADDLLVTNHQHDESESAVFAYEIPTDIRNGTFARRTIASGFVTKQPGANQASPGSPRPFHPYLNATEMEKPHIVVAGDGTQQLHLLRPRSADPDDWDYIMETMIDVSSTVGLMSVADVDGDGRAEIFTPSYDRNEVYAFQFY